MVGTDQPCQSLTHKSVICASANSTGLIFWESGDSAGGPTAFISPDHEITGTPVLEFAERVRHLEACCQVFPKLWEGKEVSDRTLGIKKASLGELNLDAPPIIVGGMSGSVLEVASRFADGWNASTLDPVHFEAMSQQIDELRSELGRKDRFDKQVQILQTQELLPKLNSLIGQFRDAGATTAILGLPGPVGVERVYRLAESVF